MAGARTNTTKGQPQSGKGLAFTQLSRLMRARAKEYTLQSIFKYGYRNNKYEKEAYEKAGNIYLGK